MNKIIQRDLLAVLNSMLTILDKNSYELAKEVGNLSDRTIHNASIFQDEDSTSLAVMVYAISKILGRGKKIDKSLLKSIQSARDLLKSSKPDDYRRHIKKCFKIISARDSKLKLYVEEVINQAKIRKGSKLFYHGISLARAGEMLGISQWELMSYIGRTKYYEDDFLAKNVKKRLSFAKSLFGVK